MQLIVQQPNRYHSSLLTVTPDRALGGYFGLPIQFQPVFSSRRKRLRRHFFHSALIQAHHSMAPSCKGQIVGRNQRSQLMLTMQPRDQFKNHFSGASIEIASRLIRQQKLRLRDQRSGECQPLLLTSGKFSRTMMPALFKPHLAQPTGSFLLRDRKSLSARQQRS